MENGMMNGEGFDDQRCGSPGGLQRSGSRNSMNGRDGRTSLLKRNQSLSAKQLVFYRNGDRFHQGHKEAVSSERFKEWDSLLGELSNKLGDAVRFVFDSETGHEVKELRDLQYGVSYVCSAVCHFTKVEGGYGSNQTQWALTSKQKQLKEITNYKGNEDGSDYCDSKQDFIRPKLVTVIKPGKKPEKKVTMLFNSKTASSLNQVLDHLSSKGTIGKVDKLFTVPGKSVKTLRDLYEDDTVFLTEKSEKEVDLSRSCRPPWRFSVIPKSVPYIPALRPSITRPYKEFTTHLHCILSALSTPTLRPERPTTARARSVSPRLYTPRSVKGPFLRLTYSAPPRPMTAPSSAQRTPESMRKSLTPQRMNSNSSDAFKIQSNKPKAGSEKPIAIKPRPKPKAGSYKPIAIRPRAQQGPEQTNSSSNDEADGDSNDDDSTPRHGYYVYDHGEKILRAYTQGEGKPMASVRPMIAGDIAGSDSDNSDNKDSDILDLKPMNLNIVQGSDSSEVSM